ncbi:hypothetical protein ACFLSZ_03730 [Candidatus Bipolaricaulota bacterium]
MRTIIFALLAATCVSLCTIQASGEPYSNVASFWDLGMGARPFAMGEAFVAVADDASALFYNPAGLAWQQGTSILSTGESRPDTAAYGHVSARLSNIATGVHYFDFGTVTETDELGNAIGSFSYRNVGVIAGLGVPVTRIPYLERSSFADSFALGLNMKLTGIDTLDPGDGFGASLDFGFLLRADAPRFGNGSVSRFSFGVLIESLLGIPIKYESGHREPWEKRVAIGSSITLRDALITSFEIRSLGSFHFGIEWTPSPQFALRAGLKRDGVWMPSAGIGVVLDRFTIDFTLVSHPYLADQYRASFGMSW